MRFIYCPHCGQKLIEREIGDEGLVPYCERCAKPLFEMPSACVIVVAVNEQGEAALIRQSYGYQEKHVCIAGYIKIGESAEETAARELQEEIGLQAQWLRPLGSWAMPKRELLMLGFGARVPKADFTLSGEVASADWFPLRQALEEVPQQSVAQQLIQKYIDAFPEDAE